MIQNSQEHTFPFQFQAKVNLQQFVRVSQKNANLVWI